MRFLVDAQLPPRLAAFLTNHGHTAVHVESLANGVLTPDAEISAYADAEDSVVVTKGTPTSGTRTPAQHPPRSCSSLRRGTLAMMDLLALFDRRLDEIVVAFAEGSFIELHREVLIVHGMP